MSRDWKRLAAAVKAARDERNLTQVELADATGLSESTIQNLESGREYTRLPTSLARIEEYFRWAPGSAQEVLAGGEPTLLPEPVEDEVSPPSAAPSGPNLAEGMPLRVAQELTQGKVVDTEVVDLTPPGSNSRMIAVWLRDADQPVDTDVYREELREWSRVQRALRGIPSEPEES